MKKLLFILSFCLPVLCLAQEKETNYKTEPFKGANKIVSYYDITGDSLFTKISKYLLAYGYEIASRDKELMFITTGNKPIKHITYRLKIIIGENHITTTALYRSSIGMQIGYIKTEATDEELKYTGKAYVTRNAFDDIISFIESTKPIKIEYSK